MTMLTVHNDTAQKIHSCISPLLPFESKQIQIYIVLNYSIIIVLIEDYDHIPNNMKKHHNTMKSLFVSAVNFKSQLRRCS